MSVSVGGLWRTSVTIGENATWRQLQQLIREKTGLPESEQQITPSFDDETAECGLGDGDEVMCEWEALDGRHPLHWAGVEASG